MQLTRHGDCGAKLGVAVHFLAENDGARDDDDHTLGRVHDGRRDRAHLRQEDEGQLVVQIEEEALRVGV